MAKVLVPLALQRLTENKGEVNVQGDTVLQIVDNLERTYPGTKKLIAPEGLIQQFINIFVNGKDIRFIRNESSNVHATDEVNIVLAVSGG